LVELGEDFGPQFRGFLSSLNLFPILEIFKDFVDPKPLLSRSPPLIIPRQANLKERVPPIGPAHFCLSRSIFRASLLYETMFRKSWIFHSPTVRYVSQCPLKNISTNDINIFRTKEDKFQGLPISSPICCPTVYRGNRTTKIPRISTTGTAVT
jgi:hypothetical protein